MKNCGMALASNPALAKVAIPNRSASFSLLRV
ncbi:Uncharacterised protein [Vibrio cholerae]|nr:Uncharacterised protein [Vibrio cholerae]